MKADGFNWGRMGEGLLVALLITAAQTVIAETIKSQVNSRKKKKKDESLREYYPA